VKTRSVAITLPALALAFALTLAACGPAAGPTHESGTLPPPPTPADETDTPAPAHSTRDDSPLAQPGLSPISPLPVRPGQTVATDAAAYLAAELGISPDEVTILSAEEVDWPDASLGCPEPGMMYAQVITPGYRFTLRAGEETYEVHTDYTGENMVVCSPGSGEP